MIRVRENRLNRTIFVKIDNATKAVRKGLRTALTEIGRDNVNHMKGLIRKGPKTGKFYRKKKSGKSHQASAPGEAPASNTGNLLRSARFRVHGWSRMQFGVHAPYGKFLEEGTLNRDGSDRMKARPFLVRTVDEKSKDSFESIRLNTGQQITK